MSSRADSPYSRLNYRRLIAWPERIEREWPFLKRQMELAPHPSLLDLGSGTGEHVRHFASQGYRAVGLDRSEEQVAKARDFEGEFGELGPTFVAGDMTRTSQYLEGGFGMAICLGNALPHLEDPELAETLSETAEVLAAGGRIVLQLLNYQRILGRSIRHLPVNIRPHPDGDGEIVFLRLLRPDPEDDTHIWFYPSTLALEPGADRPLELESAKEVRLRAWRHEEVSRHLVEAGFRLEAVHGGMSEEPFDAAESPDLVIVAALGGAPRARGTSRASDEVVPRKRKPTHPPKETTDPP